MSIYISFTIWFYWLESLFKISFLSSSSTLVVGFWSDVAENGSTNKASSGSIPKISVFSEYKFYDMKMIYARFKKIICLKFKKMIYLKFKKIICLKFKKIICLKFKKNTFKV